MPEQLAGYDAWKTTRPTDRHAERLADLEADLAIKLITATEHAPEWAVDDVIIDHGGEVHARFRLKLRLGSYSVDDAAALVADRLRSLAAALEARP